MTSPAAATDQPTAPRGALATMALGALGVVYGDIGISGIKAARPVNPALDTLRAWLAALEQGLGRDDREAIYRVLRDAVPGFRKEAV